MSGRPLTPIRRAVPSRPLAIAALLALALGLHGCSRAPRSVEAAPPVPAGQAEPASDGNVLAVAGTDEVTGPAMTDGCFRIGRPLRAGFTDEQPDHLVKVKRFRLDRTEVTNEAYAAFLSAASSEKHDEPWVVPEGAAGLVKGKDGLWKAAPGKEKWPVVGVTWFGATAYCEAQGGRLPTEAEWEWAAVGPEWRVYPWGDEWDPTKCCCKENPGRPYINVGSLPEGASWCGALDMAGNCWEWCADWYGPYAADKQDNPTGPTAGAERVIRGGFYKNAADLFRGSCRLRQAPTVGRDGIGFRCAYDAPPTP